MSDEDKKVDTSKKEITIPAKTGQQRERKPISHDSEIIIEQRAPKPKPDPVDRPTQPHDSKFSVKPKIEKTNSSNQDKSKSQE